MNILASLLSVVALGAAARPLTAQTEEGAALVLSADVLHAIALDFDEGRNPFYCYFGTRSASTPDRVIVDSVTKVAAPADCAGNGLGFVSRVDDRFFMVNTMKGLIDAMPQLLVVSAFYRTEDVEHRGKMVHAAHALSIIRGAAPTVANGRS